MGIPLEDRFSDNSDIRYSSGSVQLSDTQIIEALKEIGVDSDRVSRQEKQQEQAYKILDTWQDGENKSFDEVKDLFGEDMYPSMKQWLHNKYQKREHNDTPSSQKVISKNDVIAFLERDADKIRDGLTSLVNGWKQLVKDRPRIESVDVKDSTVTEGGMTKRINGAISGLLNGKKHIDCFNDDSKTTIRIDDETIRESFAYSFKHQIPFSITEKVLKNADKLLESAVYVGSREDYADANHFVHYLAAVADNNGTKSTVLFAVHESIEKLQQEKYDRRAYVTEISILNEDMLQNKDEGDTESPNPDNNIEEAGVTSDWPSTNVSIIDLLNSVNTDRIRFYSKQKLAGNQYNWASGQHDLSDNEAQQALIEAGVITQADADAINGTNLPGMPTESGQSQRQFGHQTAQESDALHDEVKNYLYTHSDYTPDTNSGQINRSMDWVRSMANENDPDGYYAAVNAVTDPNFDYRSADGQARMLTVIGMAALKGDTETELRIADAYNQQGTDLGRQLQARKMFRLMTPIGRRTILQKEVARINQEYKNSGKDTEVHLSEFTLKAAEAAQTEEDFEKVQRAAEKELAEQMPANWKDRLRTWRMMSMLANPRTHIRNILGNWIFQPVVGLKNAIGAGLESAFVKDGNRTKAIRYTDDAKAFAKQDVLAMKDTLTGEAKYSPESKIEQNKKAFGQGKGLLSRTVGKAVQGIADFNSNMLEKEDWIFLNKHYRNALASYMTANGLTSADMTGQTLEAARTYAVLEAQKATYRDANAVSSWLNTMSRKGGIGGFLVDTVLPFKKTPANILRRGIEYSPVGLLKSFATAKRSLDLYAAWEANGKRGDMPKGAKPLTEVLDNIAAGLTGTGIAALGALGYALGAIKLGFGGDPDDELEEERGGQEYSIELFGHSFTIDWAAPVCMPFFTGAALFKEFSEAGDVKDVEDAAELFGRFINSLSSISEPIFNLSMLDGVSSLLKSTSYSNQNEIPVFELLQNIGANYVSSFVPSALGAVARTIDTTRRKSYVESGDPLRIWKQKIEQAQNKIPFLSMRNIPYRDVYGEADVSGAGEAFLENFLLPGYLNRLSDEKLTNELQRIYDTENDASVIPKAAGKTVGDIKLNDQQYDQYVVTRGQTAKALLNDLIGRDEFMTLTPTDVSQGNPEAQVQLIKDVWTYANAIARHEIDPSYKMANWVAEAYAGGNVIDSILEREEAKAQEEYNKQSKDDLFTAISEQDAEAINTSLEAMRQSGSNDKKIREDVMNQYRDQYKKAYAEGDTETMDAIKYGMLYLDLGDSSFTDPEDDKNSIFNKWEKAVDKEE